MEVLKCFLSTFWGREAAGCAGQASPSGTCLWLKRTGWQPPHSQLSRKDVFQQLTGLELRGQQIALLVF